MNPEIYFVLTKNCNLRCRHCYLESRPGLKDTTISTENFEKAVNNLPKTSPIRLILSGGEIFTIRKQLYEFLDCLKEKNELRKRKHLGKIEIALQTNGFWGKDSKMAEEILNEMKSFGITQIDLSSDDYYHKEQGLLKDRIKRIKKINDEGEYIQHITDGCRISRNSLIPIGRARNIIEISEVKTDLPMDCKKSIMNRNFYVNPQGEVSMCAYFPYNLEGKLTEKPLEEMVKLSMNNEKLMALDQQGIKGLAKYYGVPYQTTIKLISKLGKCGACYILYNLSKKGNLS